MPFELKIRLNMMSEMPTRNDTNDSGYVTVLYKINDRLQVDGFRPDHRWFRGEYNEFDKGLVLYGWLPGGTSQAFKDWHADFIRGVLEIGGRLEGRAIAPSTTTSPEPSKRRIRVDETIPNNTAAN